MKKTISCVPGSNGKTISVCVRDIPDCPLKTDLALSVIETSALLVKSALHDDLKRACIPLDETDANCEWKARVFIGSGNIEVYVAAVIEESELSIPAAIKMLKHMGYIDEDHAVAETEVKSGLGKREETPMTKRANKSLADKRSESANVWFECADIKGEIVGHDGWEHDGLRTLTRTVYFANGAKPSIAKKLVVKFADNEASDTIVEATLDGEDAFKKDETIGGKEEDAEAEEDRNRRRGLHGPEYPGENF